MKNNLIKTSVFCTSLLLSCTANSQVKTFGDFDCGYWVKNRNTQSYAEMGMRTWVTGYLSGLNAALASPKNDPLVRLSADQVYLWMDKYCRETPLSNIQLGANKLYEELEIRSKK